eukprot:scaffold31501_cov32-Tisochrysis_lutea.AAC.4
MPPALAHALVHACYRLARRWQEMLVGGQHDADIDILPPVQKLGLSVGWILPTRAAGESAQREG